MEHRLIVLCVVVAAACAQSDLEVGSGEYDESTPAECRLVPDSGFGYRKMNYWYYDNGEKRCRWFRYLGYGGNSNRFVSRAACMARCTHNIINACDAVECKAGSCQERKVVCVSGSGRRMARDIPDETLQCPPNYAVCFDNARFKHPIIPKAEYYSFVRPARCNLLVDTGIWQKDTHYRMVFFYSVRERTCKTTFAPASVFPSASKPAAAAASEPASESIQRNLFQTLDDCMDTCTQ